MILTRRNLWLRKRRLQQFDFKRRDKILDLGCGDGINAKILWDLGFTHIIGVDISEFLLRIARKRVPKVKFIHATAEKLPFKNNTFDIILADSVLYHFINSSKAIKEIARVLKKGGKLFFIESHNSIFRRLLDWITFSPASQFMTFLVGRKKGIPCRKRKHQELAEA